ncbi:DNA mismatch repair protein Mlh1 isoform X2 [Prorops nasuta]
MEIVCERFTTSKLQNFEDLKSINTFGFRGEALASISHVALLTITTKTADEKCAYKAAYIDSKLKSLPKPCAGNQGTTITIENLFYNVATRRKALSSFTEEFSKIMEVVTRYAVHYPAVGFTLKKHGVTAPQVRTLHNSTKLNNIRIIYGNPIARELLEVELEDKNYKFKMHALITNANYTAKRMVSVLFINNRLVESNAIKKMLEELYSIYLPKRMYPWCYLSLDIDPGNIDVNVHPTKHEVRFLHEDSIIERIKYALDEKLSGNSASKTFYLQARLPKVDITKDILKEVLPEYDRKSVDKTKKIYQTEIVRANSSDQKLDKFNFTVSNTSKQNEEDNDSNCISKDMFNSTLHNKIENKDESEIEKLININVMQVATPEKSKNVDEPYETSCSNRCDKTSSSSIILNPNCSGIEKNTMDNDTAYTKDDRMDKIFYAKNNSDIELEENNCSFKTDGSQVSPTKTIDVDPNKINEDKITTEFKSYSINNFRREIKLTSVLKLRKEIEDSYHEGVKEILSNLIFIGCIDKRSALIQSGVNLYICNTQTLAEELFYEIMLYDFANFGVIKFSESLPLYDMAMLALNTEEAGWTPDDGDKSDLATRAKELLLEKADMMKEYFAIVLDKRGNLKSLPMLLDQYFPYEGGLPLYLLRLATEVDWTTEQLCFQNICRETAKYYSEMNLIHNNRDWKYVTEYVLYPAIKESLLPPSHFAQDSTVLQIASLPDLYKVFERC